MATAPTKTANRLQWAEARERVMAHYDEIVTGLANGMSLTRLHASLPALADMKYHTFAYNVRAIRDGRLTPFPVAKPADRADASGPKAKNAPSPAPKTESKTEKDDGDERPYRMVADRGEAKPRIKRRKRDDLH